MEKKSSAEQQLQKSHGPKKSKRSRMARPYHSNNDDRPAGIQYAGEPGISADCLNAVLRFLQHGDKIGVVRILTFESSHGLLLAINPGDVVGIKSGFASGYGGEGPHTFSLVLELLYAHGADIDEYEVTESLIERLDSSSLSTSDLAGLENARPVRPRRWSNYIEERHILRHRDGSLWQEFPSVIPLAIVDARIIDLALSFWQAPDERLLTAYRRLEDITRERSGVDEHGTKLFSQAFLGPTAKLHWPDIDPGEQAGRGQLFTGAFGAFRNPRAHRLMRDSSEDLLGEFLVLNQLFRLERDAKQRPADRNV